MPEQAPGITVSCTTDTSKRCIKNNESVENHLHKTFSTALPDKKKLPRKVRGSFCYFVNDVK